ncbi:MAG: DUF6056 family protein [Eubacteriales bacterium]
MKLNSQKLVLLLPSLLLIGIFYLFLEQSILLGDDYFYASFLRGGFQNFLAETYSHYFNFNGRAIVHVIINLVLFFGTLIFPLVGTCMILGMGYFLVKLNSSTPTFSNIAIYSSFVVGYLLCLDIAILKEGVLWISAFFNYVYPVFIALAAFSLQHKGKLTPLLCVICFLAGATSEQGGILALATIILYTLPSLSRTASTSVRKINFVSCFSVLLGYATIILSPGTLQRMRTETSGDVKKLFDLAEYAETAWSLFLIVLDQKVQIISFFILFFLYFLFIEKDKKCFYPFAALCAGICVMLCFPVTRFTLVQAFVLFVGIFSVFVYFYWKKRFVLAALLAGGGASLLMLIPTGFTEPRVLIPFFLFLGFVVTLMSVSLLAYAQEKTKKSTYELSTYSLLLLITLILFHDDFSGAHKNYLVEKQNYQEIKQMNETKHIQYSMDFDYKYTHLLFLNNGFHYNYFIKFHQIPSDVLLQMVSEEHPKVIAEGKELPFPAISRDGTHYFALEDIILLYGYFSWSPTETLFGATFPEGEKNYSKLEIETVIRDATTGEIVFDVYGKRITDYYYALYPQEMYESLFGFTFTHDPSENILYLSK